MQAAQAAGLEFVILADEWSALFSKTPAITAFQTLMASARADFTGQLLWNVSNLEEDDIRPEIVELADMMGVSAYVPSAITNSPSIAQMYVNLTGVSQVPSVRAVVDDKRVLWGDPSVVGYKIDGGRGTQSVRAARDDVRQRDPGERLGSLPEGRAHHW